MDSYLVMSNELQLWIARFGVTTNELELYSKVYSLIMQPLPNRSSGEYESDDVGL